ncbi:MAG TPA: hypothetical protein VFO78_07845, partial [Candidatus Limnocylindrales bacterium]|nr:hypothetical protein [Candidatus Limnocylindrales bacterium]
RRGRELDDGGGFEDEALERPVAALLDARRDVGIGMLVGARWQRAGVSLSKFAGQTIRIVFTATDGGADSLVEAGLDDVRIELP